MAIQLFPSVSLHRDVYRIWILVLSGWISRRSPCNPWTLRGWLDVTVEQQCPFDQLVLICIAMAGLGFAIEYLS